MSRYIPQKKRRSSASGFARFWRGFVFVVIIACMIWSVYDANRDKFAPEGECMIHFIDVGQGDAALIVTDAGTVLVDCGPSAAENQLLKYVKRYANSIDWLVLTHPHEDHIGGAEKILKNISVGKVLMTDVVSTTSTYSRVLDALEQSTGTEVVEAKPGNHFTLGTASFTVLAPVKSGYEEINDTSIVFRMDVAGISVLFTGDAGKDAEKDILKQYRNAGLDADILKVGHHGSRTSTTNTFLAAVRPQYAVISCATGNDYGHPHSEALHRLAASGVTVYRIDRSGTVIASIKDGKVEWKTERK